MRPVPTQEEIDAANARRDALPAGVDLQIAEIEVLPAPDIRTGTVQFVKRPKMGKPIFVHPVPEATDVNEGSLQT